MVIVKNWVSNTVFERRLQTLAELRNYRNINKKYVNECKTNPVKMSSAETMQHPIWNNYIFNLREIHCSSKTLVLYVKSLFNENGNFNELMNLEIKKVSQIGYVKIKVFLPWLNPYVENTVFQI